MSPYSDTLSWFRANQPLLFLLNAVCLAKKQQIPILYLTRSGLEPKIYRTRVEYASHYTTDAVQYFRHRETCLKRTSMGYIKKRIISDVCEKYNIANNKADLIRIPLWYRQIFLTTVMTEYILNWFYTDIKCTKKYTPGDLTTVFFLCISEHFSRLILFRIQVRHT